MCVEKGHQCLPHLSLPLFSFFIIIYKSTIQVHMAPSPPCISVGKWRRRRSHRRTTSPQARKTLVCLVHARVLSPYFNRYTTNCGEYIATISITKNWILNLFFSRLKYLDFYIFMDGFYIAFFWIFLDFLWILLDFENVSFAILV